MTLKELKLRHESGDRQFKSVRVQIKTQLSRKCAQRGCNESLAFMNKTRFLCDAHIGRSPALISKNLKSRTGAKRTKSEVRALNRKKKKAYYERHGIKFDKTIRKRHAEASSQGLGYSGQILIYDNYKEPLKPVERSKGYGYYGTLALTDDKEFVQCHICSNLYANLGLHLRVHKVTGERYREIYQLASGTALISESQRQKLQERAVKPYNGELPDHLKEYNRKVQQGLIKHNGNKGKIMDKRGSWTLEKRNKEGLCPDQVLEKIKDLADKLGSTPSYEEFIKAYNYRFIGSIKFQHGSWTQAVHKIGLVTRAEMLRPDRGKLIEELQTFLKEYKRIPMTSDFNRGLLRDKGVFIRVFGSLNNARLEAGMNAVIPMPFGQIMELTPEQYFEYQSAHITKGKRSQARGLPV